MHRPKDVTTRLGISSTTLRRWAATFGDYLSPTAASAIAQTGGPAQRRYTDADVALLAAIQRELASGRTVDETLVRLQRGGLRSSPHGVAHDNTPETPELNQRASTEPPMSETLSLVGVSEPTEWHAALLALIESAPTITAALAQVEATTRELRAATEAQRSLQAELRAEREALAALRASPLVPIPAHDAPAAPVSAWQRVKRLFTEGR